MLALIGPNGAGKTHLLQHDQRPDRADVRRHRASSTGAPTGLAPRAIGRLGVGRTFQVAATFGSMTLAENVQMALLARRGELWPSLALGGAPRVATRRAPCSRSSAWPIRPTG